MRGRLLALTLALSFVGGAVLADNTDKEADEALATFRKAFSSKEESDRISAVEALAATQSKRVVDALATPLRSDKSPAVRRAAAKVIGGQWSQNAAATLVKALNPADPAKDVTTAIITALGQTESDQAVPALVSLLAVKRRAPRGAQQSGQPQDDPSLFDAPALDALKRIGSARAAEDLINFLNQESVAQGGGGRKRGGNNGGGKDPITRDAEQALAAITGQSHPNAAEWRKWWNENRDTLKVIPVYRCTGTGRTFDKPNSATKCPHDGDQHPTCGYLLKTRFEGGGLGVPEGSSNGNGQKKGRGNKNKKPAN